MLNKTRHPDSPMNRNYIDLEAAEPQRHIISVLIENESGALSRVANLFSARGYNIEAMSVAPTNEPSISRMTLVAIGNEQIIEQITKQLNKLLDVIKLIDLTETNHIEREMMLVKVSAEQANRDEIMRLADIFRGRIIDVAENSYTIELTGTGEKLTAFLDVLSKMNVIEVVRSGALAIARGDKALHL